MAIRLRAYRGVLKLMLLILLVVLSSPVLGWNATGHKISATIAWEQLAQDRRVELVDLIRKHPRYEEDFLDHVPGRIKQEGHLDAWLFQEASIWPDKLREFQGDLKDHYNRPHWHYINLPFYLPKKGHTIAESAIKQNLDFEYHGELTSELNIIQALKGNLALLNDLNAKGSDRAVALCWVLHLAGDLHQPLHASTLVTNHLFPNGDRGGTRIEIRGQGTRGNLHALWDAALGNAQSFSFIQQKARHLLKNGQSVEHKLELKRWLRESHQLGRDMVYTSPLTSVLLEYEANREPLKAVTIQEEYMMIVRRVANDQILRAGERLAILLRSGQ